MNYSVFGNSWWSVISDLCDFPLLPNWDNCLRDCWRPIIQAAEIGDFSNESVAWIFDETNEEKVKGESEILISFYKQSFSLVNFLETCLAVKTPVMKDNPVFVELQAFHKHNQDHNDCSKTFQHP